MAGARNESPIAGYYDRLAGVYGDGAYFAARRAAVLGGAAGELAAAATVLDLGCGNGAFLPALAGRERRAVGIDLSPAMLAAAQRRMGAKAGLVRGDAAALPFRAGAFDLVLMSHVLLLIGDIDACLAGVARVLRPHGVLVATVGAGGWPAAVRDVIGPDWREILGGVLGRVRPAGSRSDDHDTVDGAARRNGLTPAWRTVRFSVDWPALVEWVRLRWLTLADAEVRERAEEWLAAVQPRIGDRALDVTETVLVAAKE